MQLFIGKSGGEGGIRTPGTLIRGTHDFQSCTFNRSVTSPYLNFKYLCALPCFSNRRCLQNVSIGSVEVFSEPTIGKDSGQRRIVDAGSFTSRYTIETPVVKKTLALWPTCGSMSPQCLH